MKISLIIPYFNCRLYISKLLDSLNVHGDFEVIIVNDNSDDISDIILNYELDIIYEYVNESVGAGGARNIGVSLAKGEYIIFADSDDFFISGWYEKVLADIDSGYDVVYYSPVSIHEKNGRTSTRHIFYRNLVLDSLSGDFDFIRYRFYSPCSKLIKKIIIDRNNIFFDEVYTSNDVMFSVKLGHYADKLTVRDDPIYCILDRDSSLTKQNSEFSLDTRFNVACRVNDFLLSVNKSNRMLPMAIHVKKAFKFGIYKALFVFFYCKYKKYPIFNNFGHFYRSVIKIIKFK